MFSDEDLPDEKYWVEVDGDTRRHPYGMMKTVNRDDVEVVNSIIDADNHPKRWVIVKEGTYEAWVQVAEQNEYGYELQPAERVSAAELDAITLKQAAIRDGSNISVEEAQAFVETSEPEQVRHALVAHFYAAKADPDVPDETVDSLRELLHEHAGHVDTSHPQTVKSILEDVLGDGDENDTA